MYSTAHAGGCEASVILVTRWSIKSNHWLSMMETTHSLKGGRDWGIVCLYPNWCRTHFDKWRCEHGYHLRQKN